MSSATDDNVGACIVSEASPLSYDTCASLVEGLVEGSVSSLWYVADAAS